MLAIPHVKHAAREGWALSAEELYELASWVPEHSKRLVLLAGMVGQRERVWFEMTDDQLDLKTATLSVPAAQSKNKRPHQLYLTGIELKLFREQLLIRAPGTRLVFPTPTGKQWTESSFRQRVWEKTIAAAVKNDERADGRRSVFEGFTFHLLRHTAGSLMARAGMDPAVASERLGHSDGGALFLRTYRHLYEAEKREQAFRLEAWIRASLDSSGTDDVDEGGIRLNGAGDADGRNYAVRKPTAPGGSAFQRRLSDLSGRLDALNRPDSVDRAVERGDRLDAPGLRACDEVCLCKVESLDFVDLERP